MPRHFAIESTGDPDKDRELIEQIQRSDARIEDGVCPNGCALLVEVSDREWHCEVCGYTQYRTVLRVG